MKKVQGNDSFQRINFLYQIAKEMSTINPALSSYYGNLIINIAKKGVLKIHPDIKRQICKKCKSVFTNTTRKVRIKCKNNSKYIQHICKICNTERNFLVDKNKDNRIWLERPEATVEVIS